MSGNATSVTTQGAWEVKRSFVLPAMTHERDAQVVSRRVEQLPGVRSARTDIRRHRITVVYDITWMDCSRVLKAFADVGLPAHDTWWARFKKRWYQYADETGRDNASVPPVPCCNNPKGIDQPTKR